MRSGCSLKFIAVSLASHGQSSESLKQAVKHKWSLPHAWVDHSHSSRGQATDSGPGPAAGVEGASGALVAGLCSFHPTRSSSLVPSEKASLELDAARLCAPFSGCKLCPSCCAARGVGQPAVTGGELGAAVSRVCNTDRTQCRRCDPRAGLTKGTRENESCLRLVMQIQKWAAQLYHERESGQQC